VNSSNVAEGGQEASMTVFWANGKKFRFKKVEGISSMKKKKKKKKSALQLRGDSGQRDELVLKEGRRRVVLQQISSRLELAENDVLL